METTNYEPDIVGRILALEQRSRGLQGRVSALEMRFSPGDANAYDLTEFVAGEPPAEAARASLEGRVRALEEATRKKPPAPAVSLLDATGLVVGACMLAVGALLATDSFDLLKNPLLAFAGGLVILACAARRLLVR